MASEEDLEMSKPAAGDSNMEHRLLPRLQLQNSAMLSCTLKGMALMILLLCTSLMVSTLAYVQILGKLETLDTTSTPRLASYNVSNHVDEIPEIMQEIGFTNELLHSYLNTPLVEICYDDTHHEIDCNANHSLGAATAVGPESSSRRLSLRAIGLQALGNMVTQATSNSWSSTYRSSNYWTGSVPDDGSHSNVWPYKRDGWRPMGHDSPRCGHWITFAFTTRYQVDWSVSWDYDGQFITNARVSAIPWAAWGFNAEARVKLGAAPVLRPRGGRLVAEVQIILELRGGSRLDAWHYKDITIRLRGDGSAHHSATGNICS